MMKSFNLLRVLPVVLTLVALFTGVDARAAVETRTFSKDYSTIKFNPDVTFFSDTTGLWSDVSWCRLHEGKNPSRSSGYGLRLPLLKGHAVNVTAVRHADRHIVVKKVRLYFQEGKHLPEVRTGTTSMMSDYVEWQGAARSIDLFFREDGVILDRVEWEVEIRTGDDIVAYPQFSVVDWADFRTPTKTVTISHPDPEADIWYTTDGGNPAIRTGNAQVAHGSVDVTLTDTRVLRAIAVKDGVSSGEDTCKVVKYPEIVIRDRAWLAAHTYQWTDANGTVRTSDLTEKATDPEQIVALVKEIYTNPEIPGNTYMNPGEELTRCWYDEFYSGSVKTKWGIEAPVARPVHGVTLLLVEVVDEDYALKWRMSLNEALTTAIKSVQVLTDYRRLEEGDKGYGDEDYNPGTLYTIPASGLGRFFVMNKGRARYENNIPFYDLFEEIASSVNDRDMEGFLKGKSNVYVEHECPSVAFTQHWFNLGGNAEGVIKFYLPDYRMKNFFWSSETPNLSQDAGREVGYFCARYNPAHAPSFRLTGLVLDGDVDEAGGGENEVEVTLEWENKLGGDASSDWEYQLFTVDENGELVPLGDPTTDTQATLTFPQEEGDSDVTVVVKGRPSGAGDDEWEESNVLTLTIPGYDKSPTTAVTDVTVASGVVGVRYYNLQGIASSAPHAGANVVVTVLGDGSRRVEKRVY